LVLKSTPFQTSKDIWFQFTFVLIVFCKKTKFLQKWLTLVPLCLTKTKASDAFKIATAARVPCLQGMLVVAIACPCKHKILCLQGHAMATTSTRKKALVGPCMRLTGTPSSAHSKGHARDLQARDTRSSSSLEDCFSLACMRRI